MRPIVSAAFVAALATAGCTFGFEQANTIPQNEGANADVGGTLFLRNAFLLGGTDPIAPPPQLPLFIVLINNAPQPDQLERVTVEGGGTVQLAGPITLPPNQPVGTGSKPIGTVSGVRAPTVPMTFTFRDAEPVRLLVPVKLRAGEFANLPTTPATPTTGATPPPSPPPTTGPTPPPSPPVTASPTG